MFVPNKTNKNGKPVMWMPKPMSPATVKARSTDQRAYRQALATPTSSKQSILAAHNKAHPASAMLDNK